MEESDIPKMRSGRLAPCSSLIAYNRYREKNKVS